MKSLITFIAVTGLLMAGISSSQANTATMRADVPFQIVKGVILVNVETPGSRKTLRFIFDTGSSMTTFEETTAVRLGLGTWGNTGVTGMGHASQQYVRGVNATCGGFPLNKIAVSTNLMNISFSHGQWVDGLLGADFLQGKTVTLDFRTHRLHIEARSDSQSLSDRLFGWIPFSDRTNVIWVTVNSPDSKRPLTFLLDTGASRSTISLKLAKTMGLPLAKGHDVCVVGGKSSTWQARNFKGEIDGHRLSGSISAMDLSFAAWSFSHHMDGIVGMDFLNSQSPNLDFGSRQVALNGGNPVFTGKYADTLAAAGR